MAFDDPYNPVGPSEEPGTPEPADTTPPTISVPPYARSAVYPPPLAGKGPGPRRSPWRVLWGIVTGLSVIGNILLVIMLLGTFMLFAGSDQQGGYHEKLLESGPNSEKIVVIRVEGVIDQVMSEQVTEQLRSVRKDRHVRGVIIRINSPGGGVSASDEIYNQIYTFREEKGIPVVAFMQGIAASGGYYAAVACDKIVAEPTTITGSIGVIMGHMVLEELLKEKLGILPVVVKSGPKKDWPSAFHKPTEEQLEYLRTKLIMPAYERFVDVVAEGRHETLSRKDVLRLADGSIYSSREAAEEHLVDDIGYLRDAIDIVEGLAGIMDAKVVEYREVFSFSSLLASEANFGFKIDSKSLQKWVTPELLYMWQPY